MKEELEGIELEEDMKNEEFKEDEDIDEMKVKF